MNCQKCNHDTTEVKDSRPTEEGTQIRRRRRCSSCQHRFSTLEVTEAYLDELHEKIVRPPTGRQLMAAGKAFLSTFAKGVEIDAP